MQKIKQKMFKKINTYQSGLVAFFLIFGVICSHVVLKSSAATNCLVSNRSQWALSGTDCNFGTQINVTNQNWACSQPLSNYGVLPIKVVSNSTISWSGNAVTLDNGCQGDGNSDTIDLILEINGGGQTGGVGPQDDSAKFRQDPGAHDIQLTGKFECGAPGTGAHPDTWQFQSNGVSNLAIVNGISGNYSNGTATCQTAGGSIFWSDTTDVDILGGEYVGCNHGLNGNNSQLGSGSLITDVKFRTGRTEPTANGGDPNCQGYFASDACVNTTGMIMNNVSCQRWEPNSDTWIEQGSPSPPPPPPPPPPPAVNSTKPVYRFVHNKGDHFYTVSEQEKNLLTSRADWKYEGIGLRAHSSCAGKVPIHRFFAPLAYPAHFYTASLNEKNLLQSGGFWRYEGVAFCADSTASTSNNPVWRYMFKKNGVMHFYTLGSGEKTILDGVNSGWKYENIGWYAPKP